MQTSRDNKCGYNADTDMYTEYAPIMCAHKVDALAVANCVVSIFTTVSARVDLDAGCIYFVCRYQQEARSASWLACGIMRGAAGQAEFLL